MVRAAPPPSPSSHSSFSAGRTAEALNQSERARSSARDRRTSWRQAAATPVLLDDALSLEIGDLGGRQHQILQLALGVLWRQRLRAPDRAGRGGWLGRDRVLP